MNKKSIAIFGAGLFQGIALVAFPAVSTILTSPDAFHLTSTQYGSLFIPQAVLSIVSAFLNPVVCSRYGLKKSLLTGLTANFLSMALLALSVVFMSNPIFAFCVLIAATSCLGLGFGTLVPTVNRMVEQLYPLKVDSAVLSLNALLGVGTTLAPIFIFLFTSLGFWWGLPLFLAFAHLALALFSTKLDFPPGKNTSLSKGSQDTKIPSFTYIFISFAFLYGIIETLNGNWLAIYMQKHLDATINVQSIALATFWGMVTFGRIFFATISKYINEQTAFQIAPFISVVAFVIIASLVSGQQYWALIAFGLMGLGCSVLLPLIISFGGKQLKSIAASVPGIIISSYLLGYGVAAFGVGPLNDLGHFSLKDIYLLGAVISFVLGILSIYIVRQRNYS